MVSLILFENKARTKGVATIKESTGALVHLGVLLRDLVLDRPQHDRSVVIAARNHAAALAPVHSDAVEPVP